jgi:hypothetical protein
MLTAMNDIQTKLKAMADRYDKFWKSIGPLKPGEETDISKLKTKLECTKWDDDVCQHVEMDLMERFVRIGSRPDALLPDDYVPQKTPQSFGGTCISANEVCTPVHPEDEDHHILQVIGPTTKPATIQSVRDPVRDATLPTPIGNVQKDQFPPYAGQPSDVLPVYDVPQNIDLTPAASSSSASSS